MVKFNKKGFCPFLIYQDKVCKKNTKI
ncbi:hypothetical protein [Campylobacter coli]